MDCAIHSSAAEKRRISGVNNGINLELRDVAAEDLDFPAHVNFSWACIAPAMQKWSYGAWEYCRKAKSLLRYSSTPFFLSLRREPINLPRSVRLPRVTKPVMQTVRTALPKFHFIRLESISTPVRR